jgi:hypothetical protein
MLVVIVYTVFDIMLVYPFICKYFNSENFFNTYGMFMHTVMDQCDTLQSTQNITTSALLTGSGIKLNDHQFIPWNYTYSLDKGIEALNRMYNHLQNSSPLKEYIDNNCQFLLQRLEGHTNIPVNSVTINNLMSDDTTINLQNLYSKSYTNQLKTKSGVYLFFNPEDTHVLQCGSNIDFESRLSNHYHDVKESNKPFYKHLRFKGGIVHCWWNPIFTTPNWEVEYLQLYPKRTHEEHYIIRAFVQQYIRSAEQAVGTWTKPKFGNTVDINVWHSSWEPGQVIPNSNGHAVTWINREGIEFTANSGQLAAKKLGISHRSLTRVANCINPYYINTPNFGEVTILVDDLPMKDKVELGYNKPDNTLSNKSSLIPGQYYLFDENHKQLPYGPFNTVSEVSKYMGFSNNRQNHRWVNQLHLLKAPALGIGVYLVLNKLAGTPSILHPGKVYPSSKHPLLVTDMNTNETLEFESQSEAIRHIFGVKRGFDKILKEYVLSGKVYHYKSKSYLIKFVNPKHLEHTKLKFK